MIVSDIKQISENICYITAPFKNSKETGN